MTHKALSPDLVRQYKKHHLFELKILYGVDSVDPDADEISSDQMTELIDSVINIKVCRRHKLLPVRRINTEDPPVLVIAMVDPDNLAALDEVRKLIRLKGLDLQRIVITEEDYDRLIQIYYKEESEKRQKEEALQAKKSPGQISQC